MSEMAIKNKKRSCFCGFDAQSGHGSSEARELCCITLSERAGRARKAKVIYFFVFVFLTFNFLFSKTASASVFDEVIRGNNNIPIFDQNTDALRKKEVGVIPGVRIGGSQIPTGVLGAGIGTSLDSLYWNLANLAIHEMTQSVVRWIQHGYKGKPLFITNWKDFLLDVGDQAGGHFIDELGLDGLCQPFVPRIQLLLAGGGAFEQRARCTISDVVDNTENFYRDFQNGGWNRWFEITMIPQNNFYGAYYLSLEEKLKRESEAVISSQNEGLASGGVLGVPECHDEKVYIPPDPSNPGYDAGLYHTEQKCTTVTPGHVVASELEKALNLPTDRLAVADEVDEILGASLTQLLNTLRNHSQGLLIPEKSSNGEKGLNDLNNTNNTSAQQTLNNAGVTTGLSDALAISRDITTLKEDSSAKLTSEVGILISLKDCLESKASTTDEVISRINTASSTIPVIASDIQNQNTITNSIDTATNNLYQGAQQGADLTEIISNAIQVSELATSATLQSAQTENDQITADKLQAEADLSSCKTQ